MANHLLIVEDDELVQSLLAAYMKGEGYKVSYAGTGKEMMATLNAENIVLILLDLGLPDEDGLTPDPPNPGALVDPDHRDNPAPEPRGPVGGPGAGRRRLPDQAVRSRRSGAARAQYFGPRQEWRRRPAAGQRHRMRRLEDRCRRPQRHRPDRPGYHPDQRRV